MGVAPGATIILEQNSPSFIIKVENISLALDIESIRAIYSSSHSYAVQPYTPKSKVTAVPCPYGCTSRKRETLYIRIINKITADYNLVRYR